MSVIWIATSCDQCGWVGACVDGNLDDFPSTRPNCLDYLLHANHAIGNSFILKCSLYKGKQPFMPITDLRLNEVLSPIK